jgi:ATP synthase protein I
MPDDLQNFEAKLEAFRKKEEQKDPFKRPRTPEENSEGMNAGMRAGTEFMSHLIAGGVLGWTADYFLKTSPLFMILLILTGFGTGLYRTISIMNKKD